MVLNDESTWPPALRDKVAEHQVVFLDHELRRTRHPPATPFNGPRWDRLNYELSDFVAPYSLHGYHCTRLTDREIAGIRSGGMGLPDEHVLRQRIERLQGDGLLRPAMARRLLARHDARAPNRKGRIWFCFYPPRLVPQPGIERFFRSWGGEALYVDHEADPVTGRTLNRIGTPCLVEAEVPIAGIDLRYGLVERLGRQFLLNRGLKTMEPPELDYYTVQPVPCAQIIRVIRFPANDFLTLTDCGEWDPPLT